MESRDPRGPIFNAKPGANGAREVFKHEMGLKVRDPD